VKRDGADDDNLSHGWKIDVIPPRGLSPEDRRAWPKAHPRYPIQRRHPADAARNYMRDFPGMGHDPNVLIEATWEFRTYLVCCNPFAVLARFEWGFTIKTGKGVNPSEVTLLRQSLADDTIAWPRLVKENAQDDMFNTRLRDWIADPARECSTNPP
jgi:hypothetical protein